MTDIYDGLINQHSRMHLKEKDERIAELERQVQSRLEYESERDKVILKLMERLEIFSDLLYRYRNETPLEHQPHMIAGLVDEAFDNLYKEANAGVEEYK